MRVMHDRLTLFHWRTPWLCNAKMRSALILDATCIA